MSVRPRVTVVVSIDTEEDNWEPTRSNITVDNIRLLPKMHSFLQQLGVLPTYFTSYQVFSVPWAAEILREIGGSQAGQVGAHLHPWNTPPLAEDLVSRNSMVKNLPAELQLAKLRVLTDLFEEQLGHHPRVFRAGRFGLGASTVSALVACGYEVDSSVMPYFNWKDTSDGPDFVGAPLDVYRIDGATDPRQPIESGPVVEVPLSCAFNRTPFQKWSKVHSALEAPVCRTLHFSAIAAKTGVLRRIVLSPEITRLSDMLTVTRRLLESNVRHLQLFWHSPTLRPGLTPFCQTDQDVTRFYSDIAKYVEGLHRIAEPVFATVSQAAALANGPRSA